MTNLKEENKELRIVISGLVDQLINEIDHTSYIMNKIGAVDKLTKKQREDGKNILLHIKRLYGEKE